MSDGGFQLLAWGYGCVGVLVSLAYIGVGAWVARAARPMSGYLLIAVGVIELLLRCCFTGMRFVDLDGDAVDLIFVATNLLSAGETILMGVLVCVAVVGLAKLAGPPPVQPKQF